MLKNEMTKSSLDDNDIGREYYGKSAFGVLEDLSADNTDTGMH